MAVAKPRDTELTAQLEANRNRLRRELEKAIRDFERQYELSSAHLETELAQGRIRENSDVAAWMVAWRALQRIRSASAA